MTSSHKLVAGIVLVLCLSVFAAAAAQVPPPAGAELDAATESVKANYADNAGEAKTPADRAALARAAHVRVEFGEGFRVVNAEAAACGRPVITGIHGGCTKNVIDGVTGFANDPTSPNLVARKIAAVFDFSGKDRDAMGACGGAMAVDPFSTPVFEKSVGEFIDSCAAGAIVS
jgi:glycosyltransferase involved in cell wall biosynthesis